MTTKLSLLLILLAVFGYSQTAIEAFDGLNNAEYASLGTTVPLNQESIVAPGGTYEITTLTKLNENTLDTYSAYTPGDFAGANRVSTYNRVNDATDITIYSFEGTSGPVEGVLGLVGVKNGENLTVKYVDLAILGKFPAAFGYTNNDISAGNVTYVYLGATVPINFTGTISTNVDWYGTLKINNVLTGSNTSAFEGEVTRLKIVQVITLIPTELVSSGTITQTFYNYYDATNANMVFRTLETVVNAITQFGPINETTNIMESFISSTLSTSNNDVLSQNTMLYPNPVRNELNLILNNDILVKSISISDLSGRQILKSETNSRTLSLNQLRAGLYIATIATDKGIVSKKFIKE